MPDAPRKRGGALFPIEEGQWLLTLAGMHGEHAPADPVGYREYAASLPVSDVVEVLDEHERVSADIYRYPIPSSRRRRYEDLERFSDGLVVVGDAIASFNPVYGQGMSVAALEAVQLHHALAADDGDELALRFFQRIEQIVDDAWSASAGSDFRFSQTTGPKPVGTDLVNRYVARLFHKAHTDGRLADAFMRVVVMEERPTSLFRPSVMWRVLKPGPYSPSTVMEFPRSMQRFRDD